MATFPIVGDAVPKGKTGWVLFLDEFNSADRSVQKAAYKLILDRMVGEFHLHPNVAIICAGNLDTDNAIVEELSTALQSRLLHFTVRSDHESWIVWAGKNGIDHRIVSFIQFKPGNLNTFDPEKDITDDTYACERTWEFASDLLGQITEINSYQTLPLVAAAVGEGMARELIGYFKCVESLPSIADIKAAPSTLEIPTRPDTLYALTGSIAHNATVENIKNLMIFIRRIPSEFQAICLREMHRRNATLTSHEEVTNWFATEGVEMF